ncbi:MAG: hypothetical protein ACTHK0_16610 [Ginsengibacter sp.]
MQKIKIICAAWCISFIFGCSSNDNKKEETVHETVTDTVSASSSSDTAKTIINHTMIWSVQPEKGAKEKLQAPQNVKLDTLSSTQLVQLINNNFPDIHLDLIKISHDTIYVKIPDSKKLTNGIGDTGAENYLASATFTLTELKNIKFVNIAMQPGDHAEPGVYTRDDFKRLR